ncbi:fluoride efflux transporter FluC [Rhodococcus tibetensis]|uniref:Fluoride-specific ion channel FluC n=1 Tax=Rhodococcus tibetensis TaxID=2965064 RepID=A0ABT1QFE2_9NOCA|nr:CrcB family protein [Rhodococcus sp. FXJ9.536]MCQ4120971.1 CrcB family protein [Rhodococcus sp. FXJ9.536]
MVGGAVGAAARCQLWRWWPDDIDEFPFTTFAINVMGCFVFGLLFCLVPARGPVGLIRTFVVFGVMSGFTTFSFFAVQGVTLTSPRVGGLYLLVTPVAALGAAVVGARLGRQVR